MGNNMGTPQFICAQVARMVRNLSATWETWRPGFYPWVGKVLWRRAWQPTAVFLPGEPHGQKSPAGYSPGSPKESDMTERLSTALLLLLLLSHLSRVQAHQAPLFMGFSRQEYWSGVQSPSPKHSTVLQDVCFLIALFFLVSWFGFFLSKNGAKPRRLPNSDVK